MKRTEGESAEAIAAARRVVEGQERECGETKNRMVALDAELRMKTEESHNTSAESDARRSELSRLASSRNAIQQNQLDFDSAQRNHDEFAAGFQTKSNDIKRQLKVRHCSICTTLWRIADV